MDQALGLMGEGSRPRDPAPGLDEIVLLSDGDPNRGRLRQPAQILVALEAMTAGRGWIALALVVFATWRPMRVLIGAYLFGGVTILQFHVQALGVDIASQWLSMLPYLATIAVLVAISRDAAKIRLNAPASLGIAYHPEA